MSLNSIQQQVEDRVAANHDKIVVGVFQHMVKKHNHMSGCGCDYCKLLPEYVRAKLYVRQLKRRFYDDWNPCGLVYSESNILDYKIQSARAYIKDLKEAKNSLKLLKT